MQKPYKKYNSHIFRFYTLNVIYLYIAYINNTNPGKKYPDNKSPKKWSLRKMVPQKMVPGKIVR